MTEPVNMTLEYLVDRHLDGQSTPAERDQLNAMLHDDSAARDQFVRFCIEGRVLRESLSAAATAQRSKLNLDMDTTPTLRRSRSVWYSAAAIAAAMIIAVTAWLLLDAGSKDSNVKPAPTTAVAMLSDASADAVFAGRSATVRLGQELPIGPIQLTAGTSQVMFKSGAVVDLIGPCSFELIGPNQGRLLAGRLEAYVREEAAGFSVELPDGSRVVDLGTRFSIVLTGDGIAEVRVVEGAVALHRESSGRSAINLPQVKAGQLARLSMNSRQVEILALSRVLVSDSETGRVMAFGEDGMYCGAFVEGDLAGRPLSKPGGMAQRTDGMIYLAEAESNGRILLLNSQGRVAEVVCAGDPQIKPDAVAIGPDDRVYFTDAFDSQQVYRVEDGAARVFIPKTYAPSQKLELPRGLAFDASGALLVSDRERSMVLKFEGPQSTQPGRFVGIVARLNKPQGLVVDHDRVLVTANPSRQTGLWLISPGPVRPAAVYTDSSSSPFLIDGIVLIDGSAVISDWRSRRLIRIDPNGQISDFAHGGHGLEGPTHLLRLDPISKSD
ncbi:hypothetical protein HED60_00485 [Planctomycetales bacterium ZRK34]|nr:hypothetical protein HED60_00485 [Planctomycetales bacterium ZRK34]